MNTTLVSIHGRIQELTSLTFAFTWNPHVARDDRRVHNTIRSHRLVRLATEQGKGGDMIEQIFHGYFEEGRNIADIDVLLDLAKKVRNAFMASVAYPVLSDVTNIRVLCGGSGCFRDIFRYRRRKCEDWLID